MSNIIALRQRKIELVKKQRATLDLATHQGRDLTSAEQREYDGGIVTLTDLSEQITAEEAILDAERNMPAEEHPTPAKPGQPGPPDRGGYL